MLEVSARVFDWLTKRIAPAEQPETNAPSLRDQIEELFDPVWYLAANLDVAEAGIDPFEHYLECGMAEGREPNARFSSPYYRAVNMFDEPDAETPINHFLRVGRENGLATYPDKSDFDAVWYTSTYGDESRLRLGALQHFLLIGEPSGFDPTPNFSTLFYRAMYLSDMPTAVSPWLHYLRAGRPSECPPWPANGLFDHAWYGRQYLDVAASSSDFLRHFLMFGETEGRDPGPNFSTQFYRKVYLSNQPASVSPFLHYHQIGRKKGYKCYPDLRTKHATAVLSDELSLAAEIPELTRHVALMPCKPRFIVVNAYPRKDSINLCTQIYPHWSACDFVDLQTIEFEDHGIFPSFCVFPGLNRALSPNALYSLASFINSRAEVDVIAWTEENVSAGHLRHAPSADCVWPDTGQSREQGFCIRRSIIPDELLGRSDARGVANFAASFDCKVARLPCMLGYRMIVEDTHGHQSDDEREVFMENIRTGGAVLSNVVDRCGARRHIEENAGFPGDPPDDQKIANAPKRDTAVVYLARGAGQDALQRFSRFLNAYAAVPAGIGHRLIVVYKGFGSEAQLEAARKIFSPFGPEELQTQDEGFDLTAYSFAAGCIESERICFLNTNSEPAAPNWLYKLVANLLEPGIGMVGATGSFQNHKSSYPLYPAFPNMHLRTNAFMMHTRLARLILCDLDIRTKADAWLVESGGASVTRQIIRMGYAPLIVGANGRGYSPPWWATSGTYCQGDQSNILVHDNQTRLYEAASDEMKSRLRQATWGDAEATSRLFTRATL